MNLDIKLEGVVSRLAVTALAVMLVAPSLKIRFALTDLIVYAIPFGLFVFLTCFANIMAIGTVVSRIRASAVFLFAFAGPMIAFSVGAGSEADLLSRIALNMSIGVLVLLFPWNVNNLHAFIQTLAIFGVVLSINTLLFYGSDEELQYLVDENGESYLNVSYLQTSFAMGLGVICATYLVVRNMNPVTLLIFAAGWLGLAVGRGRGALLFCIVVSVLYLLLVLSSRVSSFDKRKKFTLLVLIVSFVPVVFAQTFKVSRNSEGIKNLLSTLDLEDTETSRVNLLKISVERFSESPLIGNGLGAYIDNEEYTYPHNLFLQWAVDSGIIGVLLFGVFWLIIGRAVLRSLKISDTVTINLIYVCAGLSAYVLLNYLKSSDAYMGRDLNILSIMPIACMLAIQMTNYSKKHRRRRRRRRRRF